ncbi:L-arabinose isomerase [Ruminococcus flavefaciens]|uniref:L-arabinose isomerase n=1 Tax=Ruminococcus flavefaciens TaxID=1265 RepID=A0A1K1MZH1_RUMFL|nr:L-arabinose isomerase [Ruminococcus flavefaciens]SFW28433.1 L-arabinose isomerase [Ruminococcus flavefaciens]
MKFWFITGSQFLYGEETLRQVDEDSKKIVAGLKLPFPVEYKSTVKTEREIERIIKEANYDDECAGIITFCHTFSPSKMWINGLALLQKPWLHFHTQFNETIPNEAIDMDYMNLHQSAHGDREHGFIGARLRMPRAVVAGHWQDPEVQAKIAEWQRAAVGVMFSKSLKIVRFGDNMREVAVTEGDKVEAQLKLGWQVNTFAVGDLVEIMNAVTDAEIDVLMKEYAELYDYKKEDEETIRYQAREEIAIEKILVREGAKAFSNTFEDLHGMKQLPGLATQHLMHKGYGFGAEGDWKTAGMTAIVKAMYPDGNTSFMEDYTYDYKQQLILGSHMLEVCPSIAADKPRIEVHKLGIGGKEPPARIVFEGKAGSAKALSLIDIGGRLRLISQDVECVKPFQSMPNLPVARTMWRPAPSFLEGLECWIVAGGAHHTVLSYDISDEAVRSFARIMGIELVVINKDTTVNGLERDIMIGDVIYGR